MDELIKKKLRKALGVGDEMVLGRFEELVQVSILEYILEKLNKEEAERFLDLAESNDGEALMFLREKIPNFDQELARIAKEETDNVRRRS